MAAEPIAIIGMSCRFPDAPDVASFWQNLTKGHEAVRPLTTTEIQQQGIDPALAAHPDYINSGTKIDGADRFDHAFFGYSPREAELMDPQHRLFLEECRRLMDIANLTRSGLTIGAFAGCRQSTYQQLLPPIRAEEITRTDSFQQLMGNDKDYLVTRAAYKLNLTGPAVTVQTACSSSLVAVHQAIESLLRKECDAAIAGGVAISFPQGVGYFRQSGMIFSEDGHCRPFSADGTGIVAGNGLGLVALKRLTDAERDGDVVHAVILGSAVSNDGNAKIGYTAPGRTGQQRAIRDALARAGVSPSQIGMLEAHGTGTPLGDPVEVEAISEIYRAAGVEPQTVAIGSVKGNVGHLDTAAGIASLIKASLSVASGTIPPSLHCAPSNPRISFASTPFLPTEKTTEWPDRFNRRLAAVSSFGIGGTNCHMIVAAAPVRQASIKSGDFQDQILVWSARSEAALQGSTTALADTLSDDALPAQCTTAALRRQHFAHRIAVTGRTVDDLKTALATAKPVQASIGGRVAWMFSGQGSHFTGMGARLRQDNPVFRDAFNACLTGFDANGIRHLDQVINDPDRAGDLNRTLYTQPALFTWHYAFSRMLLDWGMQPDLVFGHSVGEFAAAVTAGMLTLDDAIHLVAHRARLMEEATAPGAMIALSLEQQELEQRLHRHSDVSIAAINGPNRFSLSGSQSAIDRLVVELALDKIAHHRLGVNRAFHSTTMDATEIPFKAACRAVQIGASECDMLSTLTADLLEPAALGPDYWYRQLRQPVRFLDAAQRLADFEVDQVIEIGPDGSFSRLLTGCDIAAAVVTATDRHLDNEASVIAALYCAGYETPLEHRYHSAQAGFASLPPVSLMSTRIWPEPISKPDTVRNAGSALEPLLGALWAPFSEASTALNFVFNRPLPIAAKALSATNNRGFLGQGSIALEMEDGTFTAQYRPSTAPTLPDQPGIPLSVWLQAAIAADKTVLSAWITPSWHHTKEVQESDDRIFLSDGQRCVGWMDIGEPASASSDMPVQIWRWSWHEVARLYQQKLSNSSIARREDWLIVGHGPVADELAAMGRWIGHNVVQNGVPVEGSFSHIVDCRALSTKVDFSQGSAAMTLALDRALVWLRYALKRPTCRITMLLANACDPHTGNPTGPNWAVMQLWRSLCNEHPHLPMTCIDIGHGSDIETLTGHLEHFHDLGSALALRDGRLYEPTIEAKPAREDHQPILWKDQPATLIAGFGAVGRELAQWLAGQGCKHLVVVLHREPDAIQKDYIKGLRMGGLRLDIVHANLSDEAALRLAISELGVAIGQVFHTAHAGTSALFSDETADRFRTATTVKIEGSIALYRAVADQPLALFCLFSSAASLLAMPGAAYNVANAWQDAFAQHLRNQGVPALSIAWGQFAMDRRSDKLDQLAKTSLRPIPANTGFAIMNGILKDGASGLVPICVDPTALAAAAGSMPATRSMLRMLLTPVADTKHEDDFEISLDGLGETEKAEAIGSYLRRVIGKRLKFDGEGLAINQPLTEQGVDSLIFLELVHIINRCFELALPPTAGYEHRTIAALAAHIAGLMAKKQDIDFSRQLDRGNIEIIASPDQRFHPFPLTDLQQAFWVGRKGGMRLGSVSCHEYLEIELDDLNVAKLETAWNRLIARHEMMRCIITPDGEQQILAKTPPYKIEQRNLSALSAQDRNNRLTEIRERMSYQVFDPQVWPLFELTVSHLPGGTTRLHLDMDLLVFDIQSFRIVFGELATLLANPAATLPELELSFRDYVLAEEAARQGAAWEKAQNFWLEKLETFPSAPELPLRRKPEEIARPTFRTLDHRLSSSQWKQFQSQATKRGLTASGALLTAFTQVLATYSKTPEFTLNVTYFNRKNVHPQVMEICGDFTSLMLLPVAARPHEPFIDAAKRTQNDLWQALEHREFNGIRLMRELGRRRNAGADGIDMPVVFTSMIGMDFDDPNRADWPLTSRQVFQINQTPQVWLDYQATEYGGALVTRWFIADDLFEPQLIDGMFRAYTDFLQALAMDGSSWDALATDIRTEADRLLAAGTQTVAERPKDLLMPDLIQQTADAAPENPAILSPQGTRTYASLRAGVNRLANYLVALGVKPSEPVAVVMSRQPDAVLAALAIQAAGACYVPVNGEYENERLLAILDDLSPFAVLTCGTNLALPERLRCIDLAEMSLAHLPDTRPIRRQAEEDLAYIIYTSGTTGQPKGAMLDHRGPINTITALIDRLGVTQQDRTLSLSAFHHDMSVFDIYAMMAVGGAIILPDRDRSKDAMHWLELVREYRPTIINAVPAFVSMLLDAQALAQVDLPAPRHVMMGGDWIPLELVHRLKALWPGCEVHSIGGPTETAIVSAYYHIREVNPTWTKIPYGRPLENQTCRILNAAGQDCPIGVVGEICTGGLAMSLGYWADAARTSERYRIHAQSGERLFHTGDLGRLNPDGEIEIIGRIDNQLKISGMRIEASEIEAVLGEHPHIAEAAVIYGGTPLKQLHGYFTPSSTAQANHSEASGDNGWHRALTVGEWACNDLPEDFDLYDYGNHFSNMEQLSTWVMLATIQNAGHCRTVGDRATADELIADLRVIGKYRKLFISWLNVLESDGYLSREGATYQATDRIILAERLPALKARIAARATQGAEYDRRIWSLYERCIADPPALLEGRLNPLELMFEGGRTEFVESWYRENPISKHFNFVAGEAVRGLFEGCDPDRTIRILEFGAGIGSVTHDILKALPHDNFTYAFTDLSHYFLDNAKEMFANWPQMHFGLFDINQDPALQGFDPGTYDLIIGANVLHDAVDVNRSSRLLRSLLKSSGHLLLVEGTRNPRFQLVSLGFVEGLSHYKDERLATNLPMLDAGQWQSVLSHAGFALQAALPKSGNPVERMNYHVILAQNAVTATVVDHADLTQWLKSKLPDYMVPHRWHQLSAMPLTLNGKVDRARLQQAVELEMQPPEQAEDPLAAGLETRLAGLWQEILGQAVVSASANFFVLGGDSLLMTRLSSMLQHQFGVAPDLASLLRHPLLKDQARIIAEIAGNTAEVLDDEAFESGVI